MYLTHVRLGSHFASGHLHQAGSTVSLSRSNIDRTLPQCVSRGSCGPGAHGEKILASHAVFDAAMDRRLHRYDHDHANVGQPVHGHTTHLGHIARPKAGQSRSRCYMRPRARLEFAVQKRNADGSSRQRSSDPLSLAWGSARQPFHLAAPGQTYMDSYMFNRFINYPLCALSLHKTSLGSQSWWREVAPKTP